jgi:hypothetical protein
MVCGQPVCDLVVTLDDAISAIYSAILVSEEGTASTFQGFARGVHDAWAAVQPLHGSWEPLFPHAENGRSG